MDMWCYFCKFFTNCQETTFITDWGDEVSLERGVCCQDNSIVSPQECCHIDWEEKAWIERMEDENERLNNSQQQYGRNEILWWEEWNERQKYSENFSIITREELEKIIQEK